MGDQACCCFYLPVVAPLDSCCQILPLLCELHTLLSVVLDLGVWLVGFWVFVGKLFNKYKPGKCILFNFKVKLPQKEGQVSFHWGTPSLKIILSLVFNTNSKRNFFSEERCKTHLNSCKVCTRVSSFGGSL